ncbi:tryptophan synthase subunit alpha [Sphingomonas sp. HDW15A]|uniref:tryptophan synthase subunit alpha n=1 Tax=Sphingomonas sp. HDW15A TaxID=2714942 RepID=UPI00140C94B7|nr:tryptophan synthase subunit alpha [Sphingomonas sp. HDW15A]QIK95284.1 tryptophan synthase subunit alpha [Sphingomonas sp. HDW15A]
MSRYASMFAACRAQNRIAFGGFLMLGHPSPSATAELLDALVEGGADMVELGIPFSDPVADGPVIARAGKQALEAGVTPDDCLGMIAAFRARHPAVPVGILTYANIVMARGRSAFARELADAGADSLLVADVPSIEAEPWAEDMIAAGIDPVLIAAPNTPDSALQRIAGLGRGYTYCVARSGVTGSGEAPRLAHGALFAALERHGAHPPVLGFGISTAEHVAAAAQAGAAGVIVGSALVQIAALEDGPAQVRDFCRALARA